jgi:hypothetical protein
MIKPPSLDKLSDFTKALQEYRQQVTAEPYVRTCGSLIQIAFSF